MKVINFFTLLCLIISLTGCVSMQPASQPANNRKATWHQRQAALSQLRTWKITGATAIQTQQQALSASISWQQFANKRYQIHLMGALNLGAVELTGRPGHILLKRDNGEVYTAHSPQMLMQQQLGWRLPVSNLYYWIRGLPAPNQSKKTKFDRFGHLVRLQQQGWTIHYQRYTGVGEYDLPSKLVLQNRHVKVKLVVSKWQV